MSAPGSELRTPSAATAALFVPLLWLDLQMQRSGGPGIIAFELAGAERAPGMLRAWGPDGRRAARFSLLLDFPYLLSYTLLNVRLTRRARAALASRRILPGGFTAARPSWSVVRNAEARPGSAGRSG